MGNWRCHVVDTVQTNRCDSCTIVQIEQLYKNVQLYNFIDNIVVNLGEDSDI